MNPFLYPGVPIVNVIAAIVACRKISGDGARWVWIPWALLILYRHGITPRTVWDGVFTSHCGGSECLGQLFLGVPFVGSMAYAVTAIVVRWDAGGGVKPVDRKQAEGEG
jgi:hypothetical protein